MYITGQKAAFLNDKKELAVEVLSNYTHLFMSPEFFLEEFKSVLLQSSAAIRRRFLYLFVDESHCVVSW